MAPPKEVIWDLEPHTAAKHAILAAYLDAWYPICAHGNFPKFTYAEGFAGPGVYKGGEPGSPVIALDIFLRRRLLRPSQRLDVLLIEKDPRRVNRLREEVTKKFDEFGGRPAGLTVSLEEADCETRLLPALRQASPKREPFLAVLDGWGGPDTNPIDLARGAATRPGGEVLVTFQPQHLVRFAGVEKRATVGDRSFGDPGWRDVINQSPDKKKTYLVNTYRSSLLKAGFNYITSFEMLDEKRHDLHLVFATNHLKGLVKMKEALWKVDRYQGYRFRDPRDSNQLELLLYEGADLTPLHRAIQAKLSEGPASVVDLRTFALCETVFRDQDASTVVKRLYKDQLIASSTGKSPTIKDTVWLREPESAASAVRAASQVPLF